MKDVLERNTPPEKLSNEEVQNNINKEWFQAVLDNSLQNILALKSIRDSNGSIIDFQILFVNNKIQESVKRNNLEGKLLLEEFPGTKTSGLFHIYIEVTESGISWENDVYYNYDNFEFWASIKATKLNDGCLVTYIDISERKKAEEKERLYHQEIERSNSTIKRMLDGSIAAICLFETLRDSEGNIVDFIFKGANKAAETVNQKAEKELIGKGLIELFPGVKDVFFNDYVKVVETGATLRAERYYHFEHFNSWFEVSAIKNADGFILTFHDITLQKTAEQELKTSREMLQSVFDSSIPAIVVYKAVRDKSEDISDLEVVLANASTRSYYGVSDPIGKKYTETFPGLKESEIWSRFKEVIKTGKKADFETHYTYDGYDHWFRIIAVKLGDGLVVTSEDITERKNAEEEIRKSKELLNAIFEALPLYLSYSRVLKDNEGHIIDFALETTNELNLRQTKLSKDDLGKPVTQLLPELRKLPLYRSMIHVAESGIPHSEEVMYQEDNIEKCVLTYMIPLTEGLLVAGLDISDRKKAEEELRESKYFIQQIADTTPDVLYVYDLEIQTILYVNKVIFSDLGYSPESLYEMEDKALETLLHPDDYCKILSHLIELRTIKPGEVREIEARIKDVNGNWIWYNTRNTLFKAGEDGRAIQILGLSQNITYQKQAEATILEEKTRNLELKRINELMDTFVYAAAHDLKSPISNLKLLTDVIDTTEITDVKLKFQKKYSSIIETLEKTITGLVKVLEIENDSSAGLKKVRFKDVFHTIEKELEHKIFDAGAKITTNFSDCPSVTYIESYLLSIFRNMISNSLKYRKEDRNLIIEIQTGYSGNFVLITFKDNGIGIDMELYGKELFKPFKRFSSQSEGTGIGLHLIKSMVSKNGGDIKVDSTIGVGTTFKIYIIEYKEESANPS